MPINVYDDTSKALYGEFKKTVVLNDLRGVDDAEVRGTEYMSKYSYWCMWSYT